MSNSPHGQTRLMTSTEPDLLQERLNTFLSELPETAAVIHIQMGMASHGNHIHYSALVYYKLLDVAEW
ncbi:MAG: hypothetical protein U0Z75_06555 [Deinococcaceae bacterium]